MFWIEPSINSSSLSLFCDAFCAQLRRRTRLCLALSLSKQPFYSERLQWSGSAPAKTPFHTSSLPFSKALPPVWPQVLPSFLLAQRPGGVTGESGWPDAPWSDRQTGTDMQTGGCCCYCGPWAWFSSHPELQGEWHHSCFDRTAGRWREMEASRVYGWQHVDTRGSISGDQKEHVFVHVREGTGNVALPNRKYSFNCYKNVNRAFLLEQSGFTSTRIVFLTQEM